jgi:Raf kinase inhibitor-like YbhB/YbcL family protein
MMKVNCLRPQYKLWQMVVLLALSLVISVVAAACESREQSPEEAKMMLDLSSPAFQGGSKIPAKYSCQGQDVSPALHWGEPPQGTRSFALIMDDPDAPGGVFTHWVLFNVPLDTRDLPEAVPAQARLPDGSLQGKNDFGRTGYGGPCPPPGPAHRYRFTLYVLDRMLDLKAGVTKKQLLDAMRGHILAQGQLTGTYQR